MLIIIIILLIYIAMIFTINSMENNVTRTNIRFAKFEYNDNTYYVSAPYVERMYPYNIFKRNKVWKITVDLYNAKKEYLKKVCVQVVEIEECGINSYCDGLSNYIAKVSKETIISACQNCINIILKEKQYSQELGEWYK